MLVQTAAGFSVPAARGFVLVSVVMSGVRDRPEAVSSARLRMCQATSAREMGFILNRSLARTLPVSGPSVSLPGRSAYQSSPLAASSFLHGLQVVADAAEVGGHHGAEEAGQQPRAGSHGGVAG